MSTSADGRKVGLMVAGSVGAAFLAYWMFTGRPSKTTTPAPDAESMPTIAPNLPPAAPSVTAALPRLPAIPSESAAGAEDEPPAALPPAAPLVEGSAEANRERLPPGLSTVRLEVAALRRARKTLDSGDAASTLAQLDAYEAKFPVDALMPQAQVLRIEALAQAGRMPEATDLAHAFLRAHPADPNRERVLTLIHEKDQR